MSLAVTGSGGFPPTFGVEPRRHQVRGKASGCQDGARDTMVFIAGAAITRQYGNAVGSNAELACIVPCAFVKLLKIRRR